jgi:flagellar M-ring protein FliF
VNAILQTLRTLGPAKLAAVGVVGLAVIAFFVFLMTRLAQPEMALLYSDLDMADSGDIAAELDSLGVPYEVGGSGGTILVPADQVDRMRLAMAQAGLPSGGSLGYEIFDQADGFGTTSFVQNINRLRALEGELARTIATINGVRQARVHLVLPERELFSRDAPVPTASVFIRQEGGRVGSEQIMAIQHLVAAAVPRMEPDNISIVDDRGNLLARPGGDEADMRLASAEEMRREYERQMTARIEELLSRSVGFGNVRAQVSVDMDFDRVTVSEESYDPDSQVARSTQFVEEENQANDGAGPDPVTVAENLPEADQTAPFGAAGASERSSRIEETVNYEINRVVSNTVREVGRVNRLSVAVMVDGDYVETADGQMEYQPRSEEDIARLEALVRSAVGFDANRGDTIEVVNLPFVDSTDAGFESAEAGLMGMSRDDIFRIAEIVVLGIVAILVILLVVRPLIGRIADGGAGRGQDDEFGGLLAGPGGLQPALAGPGSVTGGALPELAPPGSGGSLVPSEGGGGDGELDAMIDISQVEGRVRASSLKKVGEIVEKHPEEAVSIIRNWMYQET